MAGITTAITTVSGAAAALGAAATGQAGSKTSEVGKGGPLTKILNWLDSSGQAAKQAQQVTKALSPYAQAISPYTSPVAAMLAATNNPGLAAAAQAAGATLGGIGGGSSGSSSATRPQGGGNNGGGCGQNGGCPNPGGSNGSGGGSNPLTPGGSLVNNNGTGVYGTRTGIDFNNNLAQIQDKSGDNGKAINNAQQQGAMIMNLTASWCGPCQQMAGTVNQLQRKDIPIVKADVDANPNVYTQHGGGSVPAFIAGYKDPATGKFVETDRITGATTKAALENLYTDATKKHKAAETDYAKAQKTPKPEENTTTQPTELNGNDIKPNESQHSKDMQDKSITDTSKTNSDELITPFAQE